MPTILALFISVSKTKKTDTLTTQRVAFTLTAYYPLKNKLAILFIFLSLVSCNRVKDAPAEQASYLPLSIGQYSVFQVRELIHNDFLERTDTLDYLLRETVIDTLRDNANNLLYKISREQSSDSGFSWDALSFAYDYINTDLAARLVDDKRYILHSFPLTERKTWDVNELNILETKTAHYCDIDQSHTLASENYAQSLRVDLGNDVDPFFQKIEEEYYARGVGLIERTIINVETQPNKYKKGNELIQTLLSTNR